MRRREEPIEEHNRVNEEKDISTQGQETKMVTRREKVGEGTIRKMGAQKEIANKILRMKK